MDNDLVLNIVEAPSGAVKHKSAIKGGRWTDRVKANRVAKRKGSRSASQSSQQLKKPKENISVELDESPRPVKKARVSVTSRPTSEQVRESKPSNPSTKPFQVVSSLFTSNPEVNIKKPPPASLANVKPSNAPLTDRSTFEGLGLDPLIVTHLSTKMNIKCPTSIQQEALPPLLSTAEVDTSDRDVFIQSQTGSGKTLSYLLPILQDLLPLSSLSFIDRSIGTLAIIIAPTRELAKQISDVLENLLSLRLRPQSETAEDTTSAARLTRWLVSGLLIGGENRSHEKARLRKGLPILVSTPGRLLDHLQNTSSFNVGKCRWLILDEADRLMELGFEESIKGILQALEGRRRLAIQAVQEGKSLEVGGWDWERRRRTILCSATIKEDVQHLAGTTLVKPIVVKGTNESEKSSANALTDNVVTPGKIHPPLASGEKFTPPSQLSQKYVIVPLKLRLVALVALLRSLLSQSQGRQGARIIVFLSCTDSVDYHWRLLGGSSIDDSVDTADEESDSDEIGEDNSEKSKGSVEKIALTSPLLPETSIYRLHGSLPLQTRLSSLKGFAGSTKLSELKNKPITESNRSSILLCTSVASRGLDLPLVRAVVQYDLPTEGGVTEYVHRVGRTARVGKGGEAWSFVLPSEEAWVPWVEGRIQDNTNDEKKVSLIPSSVDNLLRGGFGGKGKEYEERATQVQLAFERWVLKQKGNADLARKAFQSHMRAYATHPSDEKHMFHIRHLHLGHLAKAFALRDAPGSITQKGARASKSHKKRDGDRGSNSKSKSSGAKRVRDSNIPMEYDKTAEQRMQEVVRRQGRLTKKGGVLMTSGTDEYQIGGGYDLEKLAGH